MKLRLLFVFPFLLQLQMAQAQNAGLMPDFATMQYAGSIGYASGGIGYDVFRNDALSFHYGYVPQSKGGPLNIIASKLVFTIFTVRASDKVVIHPLNAGLMVSYHLGSAFRSRWPHHRYPEGYYWWRTSMKAHLLLQSSVTIRLDEKKIHALTAFVEFNTNELYLISLVQNRQSLSPRDVIKVGYGFRARF